MFRTAIKKSFVGAALCALTVLGWVGSAQALQVVGRWDPVYGTPFQIAGQDGSIQSMWWSGTGDFTIADSCVVAGTGATAKSCGSGGQMFVDNVTINLSLTQGGASFASFTFDGKADIFVANFEGGQLKSVLSDYFTPWASPTLTGTTDYFNVTKFLFNLAFNEGGALLYHSDPKAAYKHVHGHDDSEEFWKGKGLGHLAGSCTLSLDAKTKQTIIKEDTDTCGHADTRAIVNFSPIPEPQTYALMLLGLGAIGFSARWRRRGR